MFWIERWKKYFDLANVCKIMLNLVWREFLKFQWLGVHRCSEYRYLVICSYWLIGLCLLSYYLTPCCNWEKKAFEIAFPILYIQSPLSTPNRMGVSHQSFPHPTLTQQTGLRVSLIHRHWSLVSRLAYCSLLTSCGCLWIFSEWHSCLLYVLLCSYPYNFQLMELDRVHAHLTQSCIGFLYRTTLIFIWLIRLLPAV